MCARFTSKNNQNSGLYYVAKIASELRFINYLTNVSGILTLCDNSLVTTFPFSLTKISGGYKKPNAKSPHKI